MISIATRFAKHLDNNEFDQAKALMAEDCVYKFRGQSIIGPSAIIDCYQGSLDSVKGQLETIVFKSEVESLGESRFRFCFTDIIAKNGVEHTHRCEQVVLVRDNLISEIEHIDLEGEVEALEDFFEKQGVVRKRIS